MTRERFVCPGCGWDSLSWNTLICPHCENPHPNPVSSGLRIGQPVQVQWLLMGDRYQGIVKDPCHGTQGDVLVEYEDDDGSKHKINFRADGSAYSDQFRLIRASSGCLIVLLIPIAAAASLLLA